MNNAFVSAVDVLMQSSLSHKQNMEVLYCLINQGIKIDDLRAQRARFPICELRTSVFLSMLAVT